MVFTKASMSYFMVEQLASVDPPLTVDLEGKTVVVIGANTGIGLQTAIHFARMKPARLILGCRSKARGEAALEDVARATTFAAELRIIDLADFSSVVAFADTFKDEPVDILVSNAAIAETTYAVTNDNWERALQINYLSTALVSLLLAPNMIRAGQDKGTVSRLVIVSSGMHMFIDLSEAITSSSRLLEKMNDPGVCTPKTMGARYSETKLLEVLFVRALADHLAASTPLYPTSVDPGYCRSELRRSLSWGTRFVSSIADVLLGRSTEEGSRNLLYAALGPDGREGPHTRHLRGAYVSTTSVREPSNYVLSKEGYEMQERLWKETIEILGEVSPSICSNVKKYFS